MNSTSDLVLSEIWKRHRPLDVAKDVARLVTDGAAVNAPVNTGLGAPFSNNLLNSLSNCLPVSTSAPSTPEKHTIGEGVCTGGVFAGSGEWEERAAIIQFEGGFSRLEAEWRATAELGCLPVSSVASKDGFQGRRP